VRIDSIWVVAHESRAGYRLQFTRNNYPAQRRNGTVATVTAIDAEKGAMTVTLDDPHVRSGWVRTIHSAQGATAERVIAHVEAFRANTIDARSVYVAISRARSGAALYTDSRARLIEALGLRDGAQIGAIDQTLRRDRKVATIGLPSYLGLTIEQFKQLIAYRIKQYSIGI
jgi:ATP-dependent exoDNAse (exonuclease V) alpha subunit